MRETKVLEYSRQAVLQLLCEPPVPGQARAAVEYVHDYLDRKLKPSAIIHESHYVDRHYLEDYASYYARSFSSPPPVCQRIHFFTGLSHTDLQARFESAFKKKGAHTAFEQEISDKKFYLGFLVRRPLGGACIGRTVLRTYPVEDRRYYAVTRPYDVHLAGLTLKIDGLAYQEQDRGAAVCASTALWVALQRVAHVAGHRTPSPSEITRAAGSPFPASRGLELNQMAAALSSLGYVADLFEPKDNRALFRALVASCLRSQLPVILLISQKNKRTAEGPVQRGHAVTLTGYSEPPAVVKIPGAKAETPPLPMRGGSLTTVYVHDDNLGSHAHYELIDADEFADPDPRDEEGCLVLKLKRGRSDRADPAWWTVVGHLVGPPSA